MNLTRQQAINEKCKDCIYDETSGGTWRKQISDCLATDCTLHAYRPLDRARQAEKKAENLSKMTPKQIEAYKRNGERLKALKTA